MIVVLSGRIDERRHYGRWARDPGDPYGVKSNHLAFIATRMSLGPDGTVELIGLQIARFRIVE
jgi:hypothetical protein